MTAAAQTQQVACLRCGGQGGWEGWPGFTCYLCRGTGYRVRTRAAIRRAEARTAAKIRTDRCQHCDQDKTTSRWFYMRATELWCGECFDAFRAKQGAGK